VKWFRQIWRGIACLLVMGIGEAGAEYRFDIWTAESGLPQNTVRDILQTRDGYLWVGTLDGLARFDGVHFTVFNKANSPGLTSNGILALYEDREGDLWVGLTDGGLVRKHLGQFTRCGVARGFPDAGVRTISGDELGNLWVFAGAAPLLWQEGGFRSAWLENSTVLLRDDEFRGNRAGIIWATNEAGVHIFFRGKLTTLGLSNGLPSLRINHVDQDQHGNSWLATEDAGLVKMRDGKVLKIYTTQDGMPSNTVNPKASWIFPSVALEDRKGNLWVNGAGPWIGRLKDGVFTGYPSANTTASHALPSPGSAGSQINKLFEDREGNLWIATEGSGLIRAREQVVNMVSTRQGLQAANIYPVFEDRAGAIWLGTWDFGLARVNTSAVTNFALGFPHANVTAFCQERSGRLWVGTIGGVFIFEDDKISMTGVPAAFAHQPVNAICEDHNSVLWFGAERGLFQFKNGELTLREKNEAPGGITVIIEDRAGSLWIGSRSGLTRLNGDKSNSWTERDGLPSNNVTTLYEDGEGTLWIGTADGGLARFKDGLFTRYTTRDGMFDNGVFQILEDANGNFWMSSNRGIHRVNKRELTEFAEGGRRWISAVAYGKSDGMLNAECNGRRWPSGVKTRDGKLWFPTQDGVAVIDPSALSTNPEPPPVVIESFLMEREPQSLKSALRVPPGKSNIEIQYTGLSLVNSDRLKFKYRLLPADADWVQAGTRRAAYYSHVAPGHYTFTVLAANSDGVWGQTGASLPFTVLPPWYQTWWTRSLGGATLASLLFGAYRRRLRRAERARAAEQEFSRRLMESQEQERQRLAAELHDSVGQSLLVIKNRAVMALEHPANPGRMSEQIIELSNMASHALREVRGMAQDLRPFQLDELGLTKAILAMARRLADSSRIQFHADIVELKGELPKDREIHFYRIVQELLTNIVKHSQATEASVTIRKAGPVLRALVQDNGCGFDTSPADESPTQPGFGLRGIRERVRTLGGRVQLDSSGEGTTVVVEVPI
jgi:signal transduction histidine kinase/ligand-binding sensor domain-containing protein